MARMQDTLRMIDEDVLHTGVQRIGQAVVDSTANYRASVQRSVDDLAILIKALEANDVA